jgi:hypothetical protein
MSGDAVYDGFLRRQWEEGSALARQCNILELSRLPGDPASQFIAQFEDCKGLVEDDGGRIVEFDRFVVGICFPPDYLRRADVPGLITYLGPHPAPFHPNIRAPFICAHLRTGTGLVDILYACYELWTWHLYATGDEGLNHAASQWSRQQQRRRFPIDPRPLKRRTPRKDAHE